MGIAGLRETARGVLVMHSRRMDTRGGVVCDTLRAADDTESDVGARRGGGAGVPAGLGSR